MNHKRWTKILMHYLAAYDEEMMETKPVNKPTFMAWLSEELKTGQEIVAQLDELGIDPIANRKS